LRWVRMKHLLSGDFKRSGLMPLTELESKNHFCYVLMLTVGVPSNN